MENQNQKQYKDRISYKSAPKGPVAEVNFSVGKKGASKKSDHEKAPATAYISVSNQVQAIKAIAKTLGINDESLIINNDYCSFRIEGFDLMRDHMLKYMPAHEGKHINMGGLIEFRKNEFTNQQTGVTTVELVGSLISLHDPIRFTTSNYETSDVQATVPTANAVSTPAAQQVDVPVQTYQEMSDISSSVMAGLEDLPF